MAEIKDIKTQPVANSYPVDGSYATSDDGEPSVIEVRFERLLRQLAKAGVINIEDIKSIRPGVKVVQKDKFNPNVPGLIGYSIINIATGEEVAWNPTLPWTVTLPDGEHTLTAVGQQGPAGNVTHRLVERWQTDAPPVDNRQIGYGTPVYDGTKINVPGVYEPIPPAELAEINRQKGLAADPTVIDLVDKLDHANSSQIDAYLTTNVTNLAQARTVLGQVIKVLATKD